jgi:hypothetical protein
VLRELSLCQLSGARFQRIHERSLPLDLRRQTQRYLPFWRIKERLDHSSGRRSEDLFDSCAPAQTDKLRVAHTRVLIYFTEQVLTVDWLQASPAKVRKLDPEFAKMELLRLTNPMNNLLL